MWFRIRMEKVSNPQISLLKMSFHLYADQLFLPGWAFDLLGLFVFQIQEKLYIQLWCLENKFFKWKYQESRSCRESDLTNPADLKFTFIKCLERRRNAGFGPSHPSSKQLLRKNAFELLACVKLVNPTIWSQVWVETWVLSLQQELEQPWAPRALPGSSMGETRRE